MNSNRISARHVCLAGWLLLLAGCSEVRHAAPVAGIVTIDGQPAAEVYVSFQPQVAASDLATDSMGSSAVTDQAGRYQLQLSDTQEPGALVGRHVVRLSDKRSSISADGGPTKGLKPRFPAHYSDGSQTFEVPREGTDKANFDLKSK